MRMRSMKGSDLVPALDDVRQEDLQLLHELFKHALYHACVEHASTMPLRLCVLRACVAARALLRMLLMLRRATK